MSRLSRRTRLCGGARSKELASAAASSVAVGTVADVNDPIFDLFTESLVPFVGLWRLLGLYIDADAIVPIPQPFKNGLNLSRIRSELPSASSVAR